MKNLLFILFLFFVHNATAQNKTITFVAKSGVDYNKALGKCFGETKQGLLVIKMIGNFVLYSPLLIDRENVILSFVKGSKITLLGNAGGIIINANKVSIENGFFYGDGKSPSSFYDGFGILLNGVKDCKIISNQFYSLRGNGIYLAPNSKNMGCEANMISLNKFSFEQGDVMRPDASGIILGYSGIGYAHNRNVISENTIDGADRLKIGVGIIGHGSKNIFEKNVIRNCLDYGIICYESTNTDTALLNSSVINNFVTNIGQIGNAQTVKGMGIYLMKSMNSVVYGNKVKNVLRNSDRSETLGAGAITISGAFNCKVENNEIDGSAMYGFVNNYSFNSTFVNNKVYRSDKSAVHLVNVSNVYIKNNLFKYINEVIFKGYFENTKMPYIQQQWAKPKFVDRPTGIEIELSGNVIYRNGEILYFTGAPALDALPANLIGNNKFYGNKIIGKATNANDRVAFRNTSNSNKIYNNTYLDN